MTFLTSRRGVSEIVEPLPGPLAPLLGLRAGNTRPFLSLALRVPPLREKLLGIAWKASERVIENPLAHSAAAPLPPEAEILDAGSYESLLPFELACLGRRVTAVDLRKYPIEHPNLRVVEADLFRLPFGDGAFDLVTAVSTLEHLGLPSWGCPETADGDRKGLAELTRCLKPGGLIFISAPFGIRQTSWQRFYDAAAWGSLTGGLEKVWERHFRRRELKIWLPADPLELEKENTAGAFGTDGVVAGLYRKRA
ncbi:MAG: class I SAM-dependent methyltransferase [Elusimicrobiota bacterium]|jgi:SAM-dependent methyltransferase